MSGPGQPDAADPTPLAKDLLRDAFGRVAESVPDVVADLSVTELLWRPDPAANSIAWLLWHLSRVQDDHVAGIADIEQVWTVQSWHERFALPYAVGDHGFGHTSEQVGAFRLSDPRLLASYHEAVHAQTLAVLDALGADDFARIVDRRWNPPVTAAVRLVSVVDDIARHVGQAQYVGGLVRRAKRVR